jgi:rod shape-determining protein MreB
MPGRNIAIDLGTNSVTAFVQGKGIVFSESTAICYDAYDNEIICVGNKAGEMFEKAPESLILKKPVVDGIIYDFSATTQILAHFIEKLCKNSIFRPKVIISAPSGVTALEKKAIVEAACSAGAGKVYVIDEPIISALGAGLTVDNPHGVMVLDLGAGSADVAVITMGTVAYCCSLRTGGDTMDEAIQQYVRKNKDIDIGLPMAKKIKHTVGCAYKRSEELEMFSVGKDHVTGMPKTFEISSNEVYEALKDSIDEIFKGIVSVLEQVPPELYSDICSEGILLTGGLAKLPGMDKELSKRLTIKVTRAADPEHCAAKGAGYMLKNMRQLEDHGYYFRSKETIE